MSCLMQNVLNPFFFSKGDFSKDKENFSMFKTPIPVLDWSSETEKGERRRGGPGPEERRRGGPGPGDRRRRGPGPQQSHRRVCGLEPRKRKIIIKI